MRRTRPAARTRLPRDAENLVQLAAALADSGSRLEDRLLEARMETIVRAALGRGADATLEAALDQLQQQDSRAYDDLADVIEACAESAAVGAGAAEHDAIMLLLPVLAWSRHALPCVRPPAEILRNVETQTRAHLLAPAARIAFADLLYTPDQIPNGYGATASLAASLFEEASRGSTLEVDARELPEPVQYMSDLRYLIAGVLVPKGAPVFLWHAPDAPHGARKQALEAWTAQAGGVLAPVFTGCTFELLAPGAYHATLRRAERAARPFAVRATTSYVEAVLGASRGDLHATVAPFGDAQVEELRVGFAIGERSDVVQGVVWPLLGDDAEAAAEEAAAALKESGVSRLQVFEHRFPMEYCDDCGAPMYPNRGGEAVHANVPESQERASPHLH